MKIELEQKDMDCIAESVTERLLERILPYINRSASDQNEKRLYNIKETAKILGRGAWAIRHMITEEKIPCVRDGKRIFIEKAALDKFIADCKAGNG
jgi:excisionase family DNA binding protein